MQELGPEGFCIISFEDLHPRLGGRLVIQGQGAKVGRFHTPTNFGGLEVREFFHVDLFWAGSAVDCNRGVTNQ